VKLTISLDTRVVSVTDPTVKAVASVPLELLFTRANLPVAMPDGTTFELTLKRKGKPDSAALVRHTDFSSAAGNLYVGTANTNTDELRAALGIADADTNNDISTLPLDAEVAWTAPGDLPDRSKTFTVTAEAPLYISGESLPTPSVPPYPESTDVLTKSAQTLSPAEQAQVRANIGAAEAIASALIRVTVANHAAMLLLTSAQVQNGDHVSVTSDTDGQPRTYEVIDQSQLSVDGVTPGNDAAFARFAAEIGDIAGLSSELTLRQPLRSELTKYALQGATLTLNDTWLDLDAATGHFVRLAAGTETFLEGIYLAAGAIRYVYFDSPITINFGSENIFPGNIIGPYAASIRDIAVFVGHESGVVLLVNYFRADGLPFTESVTSVAGKTGAVALAKVDVGLPNVDNTSDANKPVSSATATALAGKQPIRDALTRYGLNGISAQTGATLDFPASGGWFISHNSVSAITAVTLPDGEIGWCYFSTEGATLVPSATVETPGNKTITLHVGDIAVFYGRGAGVTRVMHVYRANGFSEMREEPAPAVINAVIGVLNLSGITSNYVDIVADASGITSITGLTNGQMVFCRISANIAATHTILTNSATLRVSSGYNQGLRTNDGFIAIGRGYGIVDAICGLAGSASLDRVTFTHVYCDGRWSPDYNGLVLQYNKELSFVPSVNGWTVRDARLSRQAAGLLKITSDGTSGGGLVLTQLSAHPSPVANATILYCRDVSGTAEGYWMDEAGNATLHTPHAKDAPEHMYSGALPGTVPMSKSVNVYCGTVSYANAAGQSYVESFAEHLTRTGEELSLRDWDADQALAVAESEARHAEWEARMEALTAWESADTETRGERPTEPGEEPSIYTAKPRPEGLTLITAEELAKLRVPAEIRSDQLRLWLIDHDIPPSSVLDIIEAMEPGKDQDKARVSYEYAPTIRRDHALVEAIGVAMGMTNAEIDQAFMEASKL
jgi:hypothetical protein